MRCASVILGAGSAPARLARSRKTVATGRLPNCTPTRSWGRTCQPSDNRPVCAKQCRATFGAAQYPTCVFATSSRINGHGKRCARRHHTIAARRCRLHVELLMARARKEAAARQRWLAQATSAHRGASTALVVPARHRHRREEASEQEARRGTWPKTTPRRHNNWRDRESGPAAAASTDAK